MIRWAFFLLSIFLSRAIMAQPPLKSNPDTLTGSINGVVVEQSAKLPLTGVNVTLRGTRRGTVTDQKGKFTMAQINAGTYTVVFEYVGYAKSSLQKISIQPGQATDLDTIKLIEEPLQLADIIVTPGNYAIMGNEPSIRQTLSSDDIKIMGWAEDITRAIHRIPGISANDFSAKFNVRGGKADEVLVLLDGMQIYQPFHQKDFGGGIFSTVDVEAINDVNLLTGGFTADYGDRISGILNMNSKTARNDEQKISVGLSFINAQAFSLGTFNNNKGSWLLSARRGYLDIINQLMSNEFKLVPVYYDIYSKIGYKLNDKHRISFHGFLANDTYKLDETEYEQGKSKPNSDFVETEYGNTYTWVTLKSFFSNVLYARSLIYGGLVTKTRFWNRYDDDPNFHLTVAQLNDDRDFYLYGAKQDWSWQFSNGLLLKFGADLKKLDVNFNYSNNILYEYVNANDSLSLHNDSLDVDKTERGSQLALYLSSRFQITDPLVIETGLRYDYASYSNDKVLSPRLNMVYSLTNLTTLRAGWGYYYQAPQIDQLNIQFRENSYASTELSRQFVLGMEHFFNNGMHLRAEGYLKNNTNVPDAYYTFANIDEFFPEARDDLFKVSFKKATSRGLEFYFKYDTGDEFSWWLSYVLSEAKEFYKVIQYPGKIVRKLGEQSRPWDQRHTINADVNYRLNKLWHFNVSWQFHSGWPYTPFEVKRKQRSDGSWAYYHEFKEFNSATFPDYTRLDLRINRYFHPYDGKLTVYLQIINLLNSENISAYDHEITSSRADGFDHSIEAETWFGITPFLGFTWEF